VLDNPPGNLIVHADDLGLTTSFNEGVLESYRKGLLTSTSLRTNGLAFDDAIERVLPECRGIGVGIHLNIVEGRTARKLDGQPSAICDRDGFYNRSFFRLLAAYAFKKHRVFAEIEDDYRDQIETVLARGIEIDHLSSHQHTHAIPGIFEIVCKLAAEYGIPFVRLPRERFHLVRDTARHLAGWYPANLVKFAILKILSVVDARIARLHGVFTNDWFVGILYTGHMDLSTVRAGLRASEVRGSTSQVVEILLHPCRTVADKGERYLDAGVRDYTLAPERTRELETLQSTSLTEEVLRGEWKLTCFTCVSSAGNHDHEHQSRIETVSGGRKAQEIVKSVEESGDEGHIDRPLRAFAVMDETPFHHPQYLRRLIVECRDIEVVGIAIVSLPGGGVLQRYLLKRWRDLGPVQLGKLGWHRLSLQLAGLLPRFLRGDHEGSVEAVAKRFDIPYRRKVSAVNTKEFRSYVQSFDPDLILSSNSLIFGDKLIQTARLACINRHSALLPSYGGILPVFRAVQYGMEHTGASVHYVTSEIDGGDVLSRKWVPIFPGDTLQRLYKLCFDVGYEATVVAVRKLRMNGSVEGLSDDGIKPSYYSYPDDRDWREFRDQGGKFA